MIQEMKKLTFLIYYKEYDKFLKSLQRLGVVHIQKSDDQGVVDKYMDEIRSKQEELNDLNRIIEEMRSLLMLEELPKGGDADGAVNYVIQADGISDALHGNAQNLVRYEADYEQLKHWGSFSRSHISQLAAKGIEIKFFKAGKNFFKNYPQYAEGEVSRDDDSVYFVAFHEACEELDIPATQVELPKISIEDCCRHIAKITEQTASLREQQLRLAKTHLADIVAYRFMILNEISALSARENTAAVADGKIMVVEGWYPVLQESEIEKYLKSVNTYYEIREPNDTDDVPIKLKNNWFSRQFEVLTSMYGMPTYKEFDPTVVISVFYTLFFAICMGDCGYGILLVLFGIGVNRGVIKGGMLDMFKGLGNIIMTLGVATFVVGFFLGTFMGINLYEATWIPDGIKTLMSPFQGDISGFSIQMVMALIIGVIHIILAMTLKAICYTRNSGFMENLSTWGWLLAIAGGIICAALGGANVLDETQMKWAMIAIGGISALGIYLFNDVHRNPLVNVGVGVYDTYNMATGLMGDVLSYIRLYALGLSGGMLGAAFNNLSGMLIEGEHSIYVLPILWIFGILILVAGHALNLAMSALGAFVHPLRLTFVEYFKNLGYEGSGTAYTPFKSL